MIFQNVGHLLQLQSQLFIFIPATTVCIVGRNSCREPEISMAEGQWTEEIAHNFLSNTPLKLMSLVRGGGSPSFRFFFITNKNNTKLTTYKHSVSAVAGEDMVSSSSNYDSTYINI